MTSSVTVDARLALSPKQLQRTAKRLQAAWPTPLTRAQAYHQLALALGFESLHHLQRSTPDEHNNATSALTAWGKDLMTLALDAPLQLQVTAQGISRQALSDPLSGTPNASPVPKKCQRSLAEVLALIDEGLGVPWSRCRPAIFTCPTQPTIHWVCVPTHTPDTRTDAFHGVEVWARADHQVPSLHDLGVSPRLAHLLQQHEQGVILHIGGPDTTDYRQDVQRAVAMERLNRGLPAGLRALSPDLNLADVAVFPPGMILRGPFYEAIEHAKDVPWVALEATPTATHLMVAGAWQAKWPQHALSLSMEHETLIGGLIAWVKAMSPGTQSMNAFVRQKAMKDRLTAAVFYATDPQGGPIRRWVLSPEAIRDLMFTPEQDWAGAVQNQWREDDGQVTPGPAETLRAETKENQAPQMVRRAT